VKLFETFNTFGKGNNPVDLPDYFEMKIPLWADRVMADDAGSDNKVRQINFIYSSNIRPVLNKRYTFSDFIKLYNSHCCQKKKSSTLLVKNKETILLSETYSKNIFCT
jgi:hypothetical protein